MSKPTYPLIQIRNRAGAEDQLTTGGNTEVLLDGQVLRSARFVKFEVDSRKIAKVTIELYATVEADLVADLELASAEEITEKLRLYRLKSKPKS